MKSIFIKLLVVMSFFWLFGNSDVFAAQIDCYYKSNDGEKIKITVDENGNGTLFKEENYSVGYAFIPLNRMYKQDVKVGWGDKEERLASINGLYLKENGDSISACPGVLTTYLPTGSKEFETYIYYEDIYDVNINPDGMPIIEFSNEGYVSNDVNKTVSYFIDKPSDVQNIIQTSILTSIKEYCFSGSFNTFCAANIGPNIKEGTNFTVKNYHLQIDETFKEEPPVVGEYIECFYRNAYGYNLKFHFYHGTNQHRHWITNTTTWPEGEGDLSSIHDDDSNFSTCPTTINFHLGYGTAYDRQLFQIPPTCDAEDAECFYREDLELEYGDNSSKVITYYDTTNSNSTIKIKVLKIPDNDGKEYKIVLNDNKEIGHVNEMSKYYDLLKLGTSDAYPGYIYEKNGSYTISEKEPNVYKKENTEGYDRVYMLGLGMLEIQGFGEKKIIETCESLFDDSFVSLVKRNFFRLIYIGVPILLLVLTTFDFAQVVFVDDKDGIQNAFKKFKKRLVVAVLIYFVPTILNTLIDIVGVDKVGECIKTFTELK